MPIAPHAVSGDVKEYSVVARDDVTGELVDSGVYVHTARAGPASASPADAAAAKRNRGNAGFRMTGITSPEGPHESTSPPGPADSRSAHLRRALRAGGGGS